MVTIRNVAELARVSIGTVDRVIHRRGKVSSEAEERVRSAIEELGYRPNLLARNLKLKRTLTLGVVMPESTQDGGYWELPARGIARAAVSLARQQVEVVFFHHDRYDERSLRASFEQVLAAGLDGLLLAPVFPASCGDLIRSIPSRIPYVFFDSDVPEADRLAYIGQDSYRSGRLAAQLLSMTAGANRHLALIRVLPTDHHIEERIRGFRTFLEDRPELRVTTCDVDGDGGQESFDEVIEPLLAPEDRPGGLFVTNARIFQVARTVQRIPRHWQPVLVGYDLIARNVELLRAGHIDFLISQNPDQQGHEGIQTLFRYLALGETVPERIPMPLDIVTKENVDFYHSREEESS